MKKVTICHKGHEINISSKALEAHLAHGDSYEYEECTEENKGDDGGVYHDAGDDSDGGDTFDPDRDSGIDAGTELDSGFPVSEEDAGFDSGITLLEPVDVDAGQFTLADGGPNQAAVPAGCTCNSTNILDVTLLAVFAFSSLFLYRTSIYHLQKQKIRKDS